MDMYKQCESDALTFNTVESVRQNSSPQQQNTVTPFALCIITAQRSTLPLIATSNNPTMGPTQPLLLNYKSYGMLMCVIPIQHVSESLKYMTN